MCWCLWLHFMTCFSVCNTWGSLSCLPSALTLITGWFPSSGLNAWGVLGAFWVPLLNLIKQWGELGAGADSAFTEASLCRCWSRGGPGLACITHRKTPGSSQTVQAPAVRPWIPHWLHIYKEHIALLEPRSKSSRSHREAPHFLLSLRREM